MVWVFLFFRNIYSSAFIPEAENYVLKYLKNTKHKNLLESSERLHQPSNPKILSPESDKFFTPKCSPSELYKPFSLFTTSQEEISLSRSKNNASVRSYYRIVSVDDFQSENQRDLDTPLEKELAEQDELFKSLKFITAKKKTPTKPITLPLSRANKSSWRESKEPIKRLPLWRPRLCEVDAPLRASIYSQQKAPQRRAGNVACGLPACSSPEMDLSSTTPDSGLDLSSTAPMDTSTDMPLSGTSDSRPLPPEKTMLRSGDEPEITCLVGETENNVRLIQSPSSIRDVEKLLTETTKKAPVDKKLEDYDMARLDAMEKNMKECELFLAMEKLAASRCGQNISSDNRLFIVEDENQTENEKTDAPATCELEMNVGLEGAAVSLPAVSTPPSSPQREASSVPDPTPDNSWKPSSASSNFFIDASSLLDEDEVASPPMSLPPLRIVEPTDLVRSGGEEEEDGVPGSAGTIDPLLERRQGELIFRSSIPCFSRHEVGNPNLACGSFDADLEQEQVVPEGESGDELNLGEESSSRVFEREPNPYCPYSQSLPFDSMISRFELKSLEPVKTEENFNIPMESHTTAVSLDQLSSSPGLAKPEVVSSKAVDMPVRKISAECVPIVSGGASPKDFSVLSHVGSPHPQRRHEQVPIISGGMDIIEEPKPERKHEPTGEVWVVDVGPVRGQGKRLLRGTSSESESESAAKERFSPLPKVVQDLRLVESPCASVKDSTHQCDVLNEERLRSFPVEKSASLGYFIEFETGEPQEPLPIKPKKHKNDSSNLKKNIFSMFIDMKDEKSECKKEIDSGAESLTPKATRDGSREAIAALDSDGTESGSGSISSKTSSKKPLYMFIEAESPVVRRKASPGAPGVLKLSQKKTSTDDDRSFHGPKSFSDRSDLADDISLTSLESGDSKTLNATSGRGSMERDVWHWDNASHQSHETWSNCDDVRITYKEKDSELKIKEVIFRKDSTFIIDGNESKMKAGPAGSSDLHTVIEATPPKSPIKSPKPEERDSGVIATEESDDSFVRLSDMDNTGKNPYMEPSKRRQEVQSVGKPSAEPSKRRQGARTMQSGSRMTQSIPEATWHQKKPSRIPEREKLMTRSIGGGVTAGAGGPRGVSKSLSRLFPNLSASTLSLARTQTSDMSEPSSMLSSMDPYGLGKHYYFWSKF